MDPAGLISDFGGTGTMSLLIFCRFVLDIFILAKIKYLWDDFNVPDPLCRHRLVYCIRHK